jgi:hypothetical protein
MKQFLLALLFITGVSSVSFSQDAIYTATGNRLENAQLSDISEDRITFTVQRGDKTSTHNLLRENVLVAFSSTGNFLAIGDLSSDISVAKQQLKAFQTAAPRSDGTDYLVKAIPFSVIPAKISYSNTAVVNYLTSDGQSASIPVGELIAILHRDGRHTLFIDPVEVAPLLASIKQKIDNGLAPMHSSSPPKAATKIPQTESKTPDDPNPIDKRKETVVPQTSSSVLSEADYQYYRQKSLQKVEEFVSYLNVITDKSLSTDMRNKAIDHASSLFMPAATIEVTSKSKPGSKRYPIRQYLANLKLLPYESTSIEWTDIQYMKDLSLAADGNYYGVISGQQTFLGYGKGGSYTDITPKNIRVKLKKDTVTIDGADKNKWNLLLGSIGVAAN